MNFVDFRKAFDYRHRPSMWKLLECYGLQENIIDILNDMYEESKFSFRVLSCIRSAESGRPLAPTFQLCSTFFFERA